MGTYSLKKEREWFPTAGVICAWPDVCSLWGRRLFHVLAVAMPGSCVFHDIWLEKPAFTEWLVKDPDKRKARCKICLKSFGLGTMGEAALRSHMAGKKHTLFSARHRALRTPSLADTLVPRHDAVVEPSVTTTEVDNPGPETQQNQQQRHMNVQAQAPAAVSSFVVREETLKAEILWCLHTVRCHNSFRSNEGIEEIFREMFSDSDLAKRFSCGEKKTAYIASFGLAPHFISLLENRLKNEKFVLCFDESFNKITKTEQLDVHIRFWDRDAVTTRYLTSEFLGHADSQTLLDKILHSIDNLNLRMVQQISMDGPAVNWKFIKMFQDKMEKDNGNLLIDVGSCGLHVVHGALRDGFVKPEKNIHHYLSALYRLFQDTPARCEDFIKLTGSTAFPLKFCQHRWVENVSVAERALEIHENVNKFVKTVNDGVLKDPNTKSFQTVKEAMKDVLLTTRIHAFLTVAKQLHPFLTLYQADRPLLPFMCEDLTYLLRGLLQAFIKPSVLKENDTTYKMINLKLEEKNSWLETSKTDLGFTAENQVKHLHSQKKISDRQVFELRQDHRQALIAVAKKLQEKSPLKYSLVRNLKCLDPRYMAADRDGSLSKFKRVLKCLVDCKKVPDNQCDDVIRQFTEFLDRSVKESVMEFREFDPKVDTCRLDVFLCGQLSKKYNLLWSVVKLLLMLSHGQASVERGFSVNKEIATVNLRERSFVALRIINDHITSVGGISGVKLTRPLIISAGSARQRYMGYLEELKRQAAAEKQTKKHQSTLDNLQELKAKKKRTEAEMQALLKSSEDFADKAEATGNILWISKSNSMRRSAKEKSQSIASLSEEINQLIQTLKN